MSKKKFSAVIITLNESEVIAETIRTIQSFADEILIIDSRSNDGTQQIARDLGAKVVEVDWKGYSATKNFGISLASHDWIFCFDADERPDEDLVKHITEIQPKEGHVYQMNRLTKFSGKNVWHGSWHPDWVVRLFNRKECKWNDSLVHEQLTPLQNKSKVKLKGYIHHTSIKDPVDFEEKIDRYANLKAKQWINRGERPHFFKKIIGPQIRFVTSFFIKRGFLDGSLGLKIALGEMELVRRQLRYFKEYNK